MEERTGKPEDNLDILGQRPPQREVWSAVLHADERAMRHAGRQPLDLAPRLHPWLW